MSEQSFVVKAVYNSNDPNDSFSSVWVCETLDDVRRTIKNKMLEWSNNLYRGSQHWNWNEFAEAWNNNNTKDMVDCWNNVSSMQFAYEQMAPVSVDREPEVLELETDTSEYP